MEQSQLNPNRTKRDDITDSIISMEWRMFDLVNKGISRASCQEDPTTFVIMRRAQYNAWSEECLESYMADLKQAEKDGVNLVELKYVLMMTGSSLDSYLDTFGVSSFRARALVNEIMTIMMDMTHRMFDKSPSLAKGMRSVDSSSDNPVNTSIETYQRCELLTYSENTLEKYLEFVTKAQMNGENIPRQIVDNTQRLREEFKTLG